MASNLATKVIEGRYAVGLTWRAIASKGSRADVALSRAQQDKAKYYVHDGSSPFFGLAHIARLSKKTKYYALAIVAARAYPGVSAFVISLPQSAGWWLGLTLNGQPLVDEIVHDREAAIHRFEKAIEDSKGLLSSVAGELSIYGDETLGIEHCHSFGLEQLNGFESDDSLLRNATKKLPPAVYLVALAAVGYLGYSQLWPVWQKYQASLHPIPAQAVVDPIAEWSLAKATWAKSIDQPVASDLSPLRNAIYKLPVMVGGWNLDAANCVFAQRWNCRVTYKRPTGIESDATNRSFENVRAKDWKITWKGSTELSASIEVLGSTSTHLALNEHVKPLVYYQVDTYSEFQSLSKIFGNINVSDLARADIPAPIAPDGKPVPRPDPKDFDDVFKADVGFTGPLRNLEILERSTHPVFWREVGFIRTASSKPNSHSSELTAVFRGVIYAKTR